MSGWFDHKVAHSKAKDIIQELIAVDIQHKCANLALICEQDQLLESSKIIKNGVQPVRHRVRHMPDREYKNAVTTNFVCWNEGVYEQEPSWEQRAGLIFDAVDKNEDGKLAEAEFKVWAEQHSDQANEFFAVLDETEFTVAGETWRIDLNCLAVHKLDDFISDWIDSLPGCLNDSLTCSSSDSKW